MQLRQKTILLIFSLVVISGCEKAGQTNLSTPMPASNIVPTIPQLKTPVPTPEAIRSPVISPTPVLGTQAAVIPATPLHNEEISIETAGQVKLLSTLDGHSNRVIDLAFSGDGAYLASSSLDGTIKLWDLTNWQVVHSFSINIAELNGIDFSPDGRLLASEGMIWDVESEQILKLLDRTKEPVHVAFSPEGSTLAVALFNQPIKLWDVIDGSVVNTLEMQPEADTFSIAFSPDGDQLAASGHGGMVWFWDIDSGKITGTIEHGNESDIHDIAFSPTGNIFASASTDYTVRLWDPDVGQTMRILRHSNGLYGVAFSPDGKLLASAGCDRTVKLWDVDSGLLLRSLSHNDEVMAVAFSPDGTLLASGGYDHRIYLWSVPQGDR